MSKHYDSLGDYDPIFDEPVDDGDEFDPGDEVYRLRHENEVLRARRDIIDHGTIAKQQAEAQQFYLKAIQHYKRAKWMHWGAVAYLLVGAALFLYPLLSDTWN